MHVQRLHAQQVSAHNRSYTKDMLMTPVTRSLQALLFQAAADSHDAKPASKFYFKICN